MSVAEMKLEAINKITSVNDQGVLQEVLDLLTNASGATESNANLAKHYDTIKAQYSDVLEKLAQ